MIGEEKPRVVQVSVRQAHNPNADQLRHSRFVLRTDTTEIYSVDRYVWPEHQGSDSRRSSTSPTRLRLLEVFVCTDRSEYALGKCPSDLGALPEDPQLIFVGFDIADDSLISALLDCEYDEHEIARLRQRWTPGLNDYHLFRRRADAADFRVLSNERVPEHAPFLVYQLWIKGKENTS